tara:strand:+ start:1377 stop:1589 length:213 start_codon:yes stop_codon:yes gene_type:complete
LLYDPQKGGFIKIPTPKNPGLGHTQARGSDPISAAISKKHRRSSETEWLQRKMRRAMHHFKNGLANADKA